MGRLRLMIQGIAILGVAMSATILSLGSEGIHGTYWLNCCGGLIASLTRNQANCFTYTANISSNLISWKMTWKDDRPRSKTIRAFGSVVSFMNTSRKCSLGTLVTVNPG